ncbi:GNAT family N-acetyltransferase [Candidatus Uabimicrobium sp. HlEnr_7]|uniref:GNAT family N-acetyltransferase n=1 Tax=Candidatus Uabimicrobium helgolandensis TaxID=3095367 RepID=UPI00355737AA
MCRFSDKIQNVNWQQLCVIYEITGLNMRKPQELEQAFQNSQYTILVYDKEKIIGAGRAISDGVYYAGIFDIAVLPDYQERGIGKEIMNYLLKQLDGQFIILTTTIGKEGFYRKLEFKKHKTAMAIYPPHKQTSAKIYLEKE